MLQNYAEFSGLELIAIFSEKNLFNIDESYNSIGVSSDSRLVKEGEIFVAIKGEKFDGHNFISKAFEANVKACMISIDEFNKLKDIYPNKSFIIVEDTLLGLGQLAAYHRNRFEIPIIAIGGSNGKTTTKEMIAKVLSSKYNVLKTYANYNNQIGVPFVLLQLNKEFDIAVLELGTNSPGEIYYLANLVKPTHALITNIGKEHLEFLLDLDGVELEETYLFSAVINSGLGFINFDDERLKNYVNILGKFVSYGISKNAQLRYSYSLNDSLNPQITINYNDNSYNINLKTIGNTSALNAVATVAVASQFNIDNNEIIKSLESFYPLESNDGYARMSINNINGIKFINDTYNANPDSMYAGLKNFELLACNGKKIAVLGDMKELGECSNEEHYKIIEYAISFCNKVLLFGDIFLQETEKFNSNKIMIFNSINSLIEELHSIAESGDSVFVKGSRSMKMELVINSYKN